jgi:hypothetical protein
MNIARRALFGGVSAAATITAALLSAAPASAAPAQPDICIHPIFCVAHGNDWASVNVNTNEIRAHNVEQDGNGVYAQVDYWHSQSGYYRSLTVWSDDGTVEADGRVDRIRICENRVGCTAYTVVPR